MPRRYRRRYRKGSALNWRREAEGFKTSSLSSSSPTALLRLSGSADMRAHLKDIECRMIVVNTSTNDYAAASGFLAWHYGKVDDEPFDSQNPKRVWAAKGLTFQNEPNAWIVGSQQIMRWPRITLTEDDRLSLYYHPHEVTGAVSIEGIIIFMKRITTLSDEKVADA